MKIKACTIALVLSVLLFPKAAISTGFFRHAKAGLLTYSVFCGLPIQAKFEQWQYRMQKTV